jgi:DNA-binding NtrC family response regulator
MQATLFIVHRNDTLLRAMLHLLASEGYRVRAAETLDALLGELASNPGPAALVLDEDGAGPAWVEQLARVPAGIPRIALTWNPTATFPADVTPLGKPFRARDLLDVLSREVARMPAGPGAPSP